MARRRGLRDFARGTRGLRAVVAGYQPSFFAQPSDLHHFMPTPSPHPPPLMAPPTTHGLMPPSPTTRFFFEIFAHSCIFHLSLSTPPLHQGSVPEVYLPSSFSPPVNDPTFLTLRSRFDGPSTNARTSSLSCFPLHFSFLLSTWWPCNRLKGFILLASISLASHALVSPRSLGMICPLLPL